MAKKRRSTAKKKKSTDDTPKMTATQGQYLAYIYLYRKLHRYSPSESEIGEYFGVSPPSVHQMIVKLEEKGFISREPGTPRSVRLIVPRSEIPELEGDDEEEAQLVGGWQRQTTGDQREKTGDARLYTFDVFLFEGPVPESFRGKVCSRTIQIRGDQTLEDLHQAIFEAYDRWEEHFYEFQFGKGPHDPKAKCYVLPPVIETSDRQNVAGDVTRTHIDSLGLKVGQAFGYWFDYGDEWWHQLNVEAIDEKAPRGKFPKIVKREGKSPPQYSEED